MPVQDVADGAAAVGVAEAQRAPLHHQLERREACRLAEERRQPAQPAVLVHGATTTTQPTKKKMHGSRQLVCI
jgi:hypothetical protein